MLNENPKYQRLKHLLEEHLLDFLPEVDQKSNTLYESMKYTLRADGKRIRPVLLLAACELMGGETTAALPYACAIEYIHNYSLIHDDLPAMDDDDLRRGNPTNHIIFGEAMAILAGDGLLSSAFETMSKDMLLYLDQPEQLKQRIRAMYEIAKGSGVRGMVAGQVADIEALDKSISAELLDYMHINKTAALIESGIKAGAYIGGSDFAKIECLSIYGENLGLAFQIADDILDVTGDVTALGKNTGNDSAMNKPTYVSIHGLEKSKERLKDLTETAICALSKMNVNTDFFIDIAKELAERTQ